ncbi:MAG: hypothetical protein Q7T71_11640 [Herbiconiux sp.]|nr:hypothetical protein [Herbiconiux sp.]
MTDLHADAALSFATDIKPLFRDFDRNSMIKIFDLWSLPDVVAHKEAILGAVKGGVMPCDGAWPADRVALLQRWIAEGSKP